MRVTSLGAAVFFFVFVSACASSAPPPTTAAKITETPKKQPDPPKVAVCTDQVDVADLFARHAKAFGSEDDVAKTLPVTISGAVTVSGKNGTYDLSIDAKRYRGSIHLKGFERAVGMDESGAWQIGNSGALSRQHPDEMRTTDEWILRRGYLSAFDPKRDRAICHLEEGKREIIVHEKIDELGSPRFVFDQDSATLIGAEFSAIDGEISARTFTWADHESALPRWPLVISQQDGNGSTIDMNRDKIGAATADAFALPAATFSMSWPKSGSVRVPMHVFGGEIFLDVVVAGKKARAMLDSGAGISIVEASGKAAEAFTTELEFGGQSATQKISFGVGELDEAHVGTLVLNKIPAARVPIPMLEQFGPNKPDVVLGWSVFEGNVVRIDYKRNELVLSRDSSSVHSANSAFVDVRVWNDKLITSAKIEGRTDPIAFQIATGKPFGLSMSATWAKRNHLDAPALAKAYTIGPIASANDPIDLYDLPDGGSDVGLVAGMIGDRALARCDAVTFDVPNRKLWLEGACGRAPAAR